MNTSKVGYSSSGKAKDSRPLPCLLVTLVLHSLGHDLGPQIPGLVVLGQKRSTIIIEPVAVSSKARMASFLTDSLAQLPVATITFPSHA